MLRFWTCFVRSSGWSSVVATVFTLLAPLDVFSQEVTARVIDGITGDPLSQAVVVLLDSTGAAILAFESNRSGQVSIVSPRPGHYRLRARHMGYADYQSEQLQFVTGRRLDLEIRMMPAPLEVSGIEAVAERNVSRLEAVGFYRRRQNAIGYFFDARQIQEAHPLKVSDLLRMTPATRGGISQRTGCPLRFVLDGVPVAFAGRQTVDDLVNTGNLIGLEVYPAPGGMGAPVQYRGPEASCGVVMVWTRE